MKCVMVGCDNESSAPICPAHVTAKPMTDAEALDPVRLATEFARAHGLDATPRELAAVKLSWMTVVEALRDVPGAWAVLGRLEWPR